MIADAVPRDHEPRTRRRHHAPVPVVMHDAVLNPVICTAGDDDSVVGAADVAVDHLDMLTVLHPHALGAVPKSHAVKAHVDSAQAVDAVAAAAVNERLGAASPLDGHHAAKLASAVGWAYNRRAGVGVAASIDENGVSRTHDVGGQNVIQRRFWCVGGCAAVGQRACCRAEHVTINTGIVDVVVGCACR